MRSILSMLILCCSVMAFPASAAEFGTKAEAVAMVKRVQAKFKAEGSEATFKAVSDKSVAEFHDRDLYPFIYDMEGLNVAHGARPALIGKNLITMALGRSLSTLCSVGRRRRSHPVWQLLRAPAAD